MSLPSEFTIPRTLAGLDGNDVDARIAVWMATRVGHLAGRTVVTVHGKDLRGGTPPGGVMPNLPAATYHGHGAIPAWPARTSGRWWSRRR